MPGSVTRLFKIALLLPMLMLASMVPPAANDQYGIAGGRPVQKLPIVIRFPQTQVIAGLQPEQPQSEFDRMRARLANAAVPFAASLGPTARPFAFTGSPDMRERAVDCLASAMWYEAGNDARGQRAVGQVVLNRVRHAAFPKSICGVVFQGSERHTGCQFTFTCDGALARTPSAAQFASARAEATAMLNGEVDQEVGLATHYHTDWVFPPWSPGMDKIAQVDSHLFFRWHGGAGQRVAMNRSYSGSEPAVPQLARISTVHRLALEKGGDTTALALPASLDFVPVPTAPEATAAQSPVLPAAQPARGIFQLAMKPSGNGAAQASAALGLCGDRAFCKVFGRLGDDPSRVAFLYVRDRRTGVDRAFWDCETYRRDNTAQCLSGDNRRWIDFQGNLYTQR